MTQEKWHQSIHGRSPLALLKHTKLLIILAVVILFITWRHVFAGTFHAFTEKHSIYPHYSTHAESSGSAIQNRTLGFQEIFALILPKRHDRAEALFKAANGSNLTLTEFEAVTDDVPAEWKPEGWDLPEPGTTGCFMSHHLVWQKMVEENISSVLIMESDADWDMRLRASLEKYATAVKAIQSEIPDSNNDTVDLSSQSTRTPNAASSSPYGDDWDLLWIGHCGARGKGNYVYRDPAAVPSDHEFTISGTPPEYEHRVAGTRYAFQMSDRGWASVVCTTSYAISNRGAHRLQAAFQKGPKANVDLWMRDTCADEKNLVCLSIFPQLITNAEAGGSNINTGEGRFKGENNKWKVEAGYGIQISARVNAERGLAWGPEENWKKEWEVESLWQYDNGAVKKGNAMGGEDEVFEESRTSGDEEEGAEEEEENLS